MTLSAKKKVGSPETRRRRIAPRADHALGDGAASSRVRACLNTRGTTVRVFASKSRSGAWTRSWPTEPPHGDDAFDRARRRARDRRVRRTETRATRVASRRARFRAHARESAHSSTDPFDARPPTFSPPPLPRGAQTATPRCTNAGLARSVFRLRRRGRRNDARRNPRCLWMCFPEPSGARTTNASCWRRDVT